jgi:DNA polymerase-3 subunit beta
MKFTCLQENLLRGLQIAKQSGMKQTSLPVLQNFLIQDLQGSLTITSTNLEVGIRAHVRGKEEGQGAITVSQEKLLAYIKNLPQEKVSLSLKESTLCIESGKDFSAEFQGITAEEFPSLPQIQAEHTITVSITDLKQSLRLAAVSLPKNDYRPEIAGVFVAKKNQTLIFTGTDGFRLTEKRIQFPALDETEFSYIIPAKTVAEVIRILDLLEDEEVGLSFGENQVTLQASQVELVSKLVEGNFPQYEGLIPQQFSRSFSVDKDDLIQAIRLSSVFASDTVNDVKLHLIDQKSLSIQSSTNMIGKNSTQIPMSLSGEADIEVTFNYNYLLDGINSCPGDVVTIHITDSDSPVILKGDNATDFFYLVMPIRE